MAVANLLYRLEQLDTELERREAELSERRRRQDRNPEPEAAEARLEDLRTQEREAGAEQRTLELDLSDLEARIKRDQTRMYGGQIVDPRELASLQKELEHYGARRDELEERLLMLMERREGLQEAVEAANRREHELRARWEEDRPALGLQTEQFASDLAGLRAERDTLSASLDARSLAVYLHLRASSGHAVSTVTDGICQWCRVTVPTKDVQHARSGALVTCTNCARILHVGS